MYGSLLSWEEIEDIVFILKNSDKDLAFVRTLATFRHAHAEYFLHGRVVRPPTELVPVPTMSMFGNYNLEVYPACAVPIVVTNTFEAQNGSRVVFAANHDESKTVDYVANVEGVGGKTVRVQAKLAPLSVVVLPLVHDM